MGVTAVGRSPGQAIGVGGSPGGGAGGGVYGGGVYADGAGGGAYGAAGVAAGGGDDGRSGVHAPAGPDGHPDPAGACGVVGPNRRLGGHHWPPSPWPNLERISAPTPSRVTALYTTIASTHSTPAVHPITGSGLSMVATSIVPWIASTPITALRTSDGWAPVRPAMRWPSAAAPTT